MPSRGYANVNRSTGAYRYGFNGKEKDADMDGNNYDYVERIYNPHIGRFLSVDPLQEKYAELTPYQFASNTPIQAVDLDGRESFTYTLANAKNQNGKPVLPLVLAKKESDGKFIDWLVGEKYFLQDPAAKNLFEFKFNSLNELKAFTHEKTVEQLRNESDAELGRMATQSALTASTLNEQNESVLESAQADAHGGGVQNMEIEEVSAITPANKQVTSAHGGNT